MQAIIHKIYTTMIRACEILTAIMLAVEMSLITVNVAARFFANHSWGWMDEFCQYTLLWLMTFGTVALLDRYALFYAEVLLILIKSPALRKTIFIVGMTTMLVFFTIVFWTGIEYVRITWSFNLDYSEIPKYWFYTCMPTWGALMFIVCVKKLIGVESPDVTEAETDL